MSDSISGRGPSANIFDFADLRIDVGRRIVSRGKTEIPLPKLSFDLLLTLLQHAPNVVSIDDFMQQVWPGLVVSPETVSQRVKLLRDALGDDPHNAKYVAGVRGLGYRVVPSVSRTARGGAEMLSAADVNVVPGDRPVDSDASAAARQRRSLSVLPFKPLGRLDCHESLALGMTNALLMRLGSLRNLTVRPLSSVRRYESPEQDPIAAGRELAVDCVLDGSIQTSSERMRISVRLIDVGSGRQLWADRFDQGLTDIFAIQDAIAERVAAALVEELSSGDRRLLRQRPTDNAQAYQLYVTGWSGLTRPSAASLANALPYLEQAVSRDPRFALAYACLADCYAVLSVFGGGAPRALFPKALAAATRALELDPELAEAHAELGHIQMVYDLDLAAAEKSLLRALEINPKSAMAHHYMGLLHISRGSLDAALASVRRAQALEPLALNFNANIGMIHYYARRYEEAVTQLQTTLGMDARFDHARSLLGRAYLRLGRPDLAIREFESRWSTTIGSRADLPMAYALSGRSAEAVAVLEQLRAEATTVFVSSFDIATVYAALGNMGEAFEWLERAIEQRAQPINFLGVDPAFDVLRADRRFATLVRRLSG